MEQLAAHVDALRSIESLLAASSFGPVELPSLFIVPSEDKSLGRVVAPPAVSPLHIAPVRLPPAVLPGQPLLFSLDLCPAYPADDAAAVAVALSSLEHTLRCSVSLTRTVGAPVGDPSTASALRQQLQASFCPNPAERSLLVSIAVPPALDFVSKYVITVDNLSLVGERPLLVDSSLSVPVGVSHEPRPIGDAWRAAKSGDVATLITALISGGSTGEGVADESDSCLRVAVRYRHSEAVASLVHMGAYAHESTTRGNTLLYNAVCLKSPECVAALLAAPGIDVNDGAGRREGPPLVRAVHALRCLWLLLAAPGIDVDAPDDKGETALIRAALIGANSAVADLLGAGASAAARNAKGETALHVATTPECISALLRAPDADINATTALGYTPLHRAVSRIPPVDERGAWLACVSTLLAAPGIDVNARDISGSTPLHLAAIRGRTTCVRALLSAPGIDAEARDSCGLTPLRHAEVRGWRAVADILRSPGRSAGAPSVGEHRAGARSKCVVQ